MKKWLMKVDIGNIDLTDAEADQIRSLDNFDLMMFLSEVNGHGWKVARRTLKFIVKAQKGKN